MRIISILILAFSVLFSGCNKNKTDNTAADGGRKITVGMVKLISHPALDLMEKGVMDELAEQGFTDVVYDQQNANGDVATGGEIANYMKNKNPDVIVAITTTTAQALLAKISDRPIVFVGVTDPIGAGLRTTTEYEKTNITGISDMPPVRDEILLVKEILPNVKRIGHIYTPSEANSVVQMKIAKQVCDELGIEFIVSPINNTAEVKQAAEVLAPKVDAIFVSKDNFVVSALNSLTDTAMKYKVPVISADPSSAPSSQVLAAYGLESYLTGRAAGKVVARVLRGEAPADIPVRNPEQMASYVNKQVAAELGITLPERLTKD